jgi:hypothetical protein
VPNRFEETFNGVATSITPPANGSPTRERITTSAERAFRDKGSSSFRLNWVRSLWDRTRPSGSKTMA